MRKTQGFQEKTQGIWQKTQGIWPKTWESANSELVNVPEFCPKKKPEGHQMLAQCLICTESLEFRRTFTSTECFLGWI